MLKRESNEETWLFLFGKLSKLLQFNTLLGFYTKCWEEPRENLAL
jgi:hypothetical protein